MEPDSEQHKPLSYRLSVTMAIGLGVFLGMIACGLIVLFFWT